MHIIKTILQNWKPIGLYMFILLVSSCNVSSLSHSGINQLSDIGARIYIEQDPYNDKENNVRVHLFDADGKQVGHKSIQLKVNNQALQLSIRSDLYYTKTISYYAQNVPISDAFYFEIEYKKDSILPLAYIKVLPVIKPENIRLPTTGNLQTDTKITWTQLPQYSTLRIWKDFKINNENTLGGGPYAESTISKSITPNGEFTVPTTFYTDSVSTITSLNVEFLAHQEGLLNPQLLQGSSIQLNAMATKTLLINGE